MCVSDDSRSMFLSFFLEPAAWNCWRWRIDKINHVELKLPSVGSSFSNVQLGLSTECKAANEDFTKLNTMLRKPFGHDRHWLCSTLKALFHLKGQCVGAWSA